MQQQDSVTSLEAKLIQAMDEIKALKEQVEQLQDQLSEKDGLLKKETRKHRNRFRAYVDCLSTLTECQANCERLEAGLHQEPPQPETSWGRQVEVEQENQLLKEEVDLLKVGQRRLEDELMTKNQLILSANEKKRAQTSAYIDCLALLTTKEQELKKSLAEVGEIKAHKDGSSFLKEQVEQLQKQLSEKDGLLKKETRKHRNRFRAYVDCLSTLTECQANCERLEAGLHQEPPQPETSWGRQVEVEEENQLLKEEVDLLKVGQRRLEDELMTKNQLILSANEKKRAQTSAYIDCLALLTTKEQELKKSLAEVGEIKAHKDGSSFLKEQVEQLQKQLSEKDGLLKKETRKHRNRFRAYVDCLSTLTECQANCERLEAGLHQEPPQPETSWGRQVEVEEENQLLKEEVDLLKVGQRRLEDELMKLHQTRSERLSCRMVEAETIWSREDEVVLKEQLNLRTAGQRRSR